MPRDDLIRVRRGTAAQWEAANPVLADGEPGWDRTAGRFKVGDGVTPWAELPYEDDPVITAVEWADIEGVPDQFPPAAHGHTAEQVGSDPAGTAEALVGPLQEVIEEGRLSPEALAAETDARLIVKGAEQSSTGFLRIAGTVPGNVPVWKSAGDARTAVIEGIHNDTTGYLFHLLAGASMGHNAALLALGVDDDGIGLLIPNKKSGRAIVIDQRSTVTASDGYAVHATQRSPAATLFRLEQQGAGVAPLLQLLSFSGMSGRLLEIINAGGEVANIQGDTGILTYARDVRVRDQSSGTASYLRLDSGAASNSSNMKMSYHGDDEDVFFAATGSAGVYYPYRMAHSASSFAIQTASNLTASVPTEPKPSEVSSWTTQLSVSNSAGVSLAAGKLRASSVGLGFFGAAAVAQPTAVADATDAATVITQLNALLARLRTLGLIAT